MSLNHDFVQLCKHNRDGSYQTQQDRKKILKLIARQLHKLGFRHLRARSIKPKHVEALVELWKEGNEWLGYKPVSDATIKNRMASVRWWSEKVQKQNVVPRTNQELGIGERTSARVSRARTLDSTILNQIESPYVRMSLRLQAAFGLRRRKREHWQATGHSYRPTNPTPNSWRSSVTRRDGETSLRHMVCGMPTRRPVILS